MWIQLSEDQAMALDRAIDEALRNAQSDIDDGCEDETIASAEESVKEYNELSEAITGQAKDQDPYKLIRAIAEENGGANRLGPMHDIRDIADAELNEEEEENTTKEDA